MYRGRFEVEAPDGTVGQLPVVLRVRDFVLPRRPILQSMIGLSAGNIYRAHGCKTPAQREAVIRLYFEEYIRARLSPFLYASGTMAFNPLPGGRINWTFVKGADGKPTGEVSVDFAGFDREAECAPLAEVGATALARALRGLLGQHVAADDAHALPGVRDAAGA